MITLFRRVPALLVLIAGLLPGCGPHEPTIASGPGPEDLEIVRIGNADALVTGTARRPLRGAAPDGKLELHRPGQDSGFLPVFHGGTPDTFPFSPAGICRVARSEDRKWRGKSLLYTTNKARCSVEVFEIRHGGLIHLARLGPSPLLSEPNGIAAFPDGSVYVSDFGLFPSWRGDRPGAAGLPGKSERTNNAVYAYVPPAEGGSGGSWHTALTGFDGANGLAAGPGGRSLLVCSWHAKEIWSFDRDPVTRSLPDRPGRRLPIDLRFHPDNLKRTAEGRYEVCGQSSLLLSALNLLFSVPCSSGGWVSFAWDGRELQAHDRSASLQGHRQSPATALPLGGQVYSGQPKAAKVFSAPLVD